MKKWTLPLLFLFLLSACSSVQSTTAPQDPSVKPTAPATPSPTPDPPLVSSSGSPPNNVSYDVVVDGKSVKSAPADLTQTFKVDNYSKLPGVFNFRGGEMRAHPSFGTIPASPSQLIKSWEFQTDSSSWGGGAGWTGQPAIIKWEPSVRKVMNLKDEYKRSVNDFVEVVYASLDGNVYFFDLSSGKQSRPAIKTGNPIKGSLSIDPRGLPLLYVGQDI